MKPFSEGYSASMLLRLFFSAVPGNCRGQALWSSLWWSLTENAIHLLMLQWRLEPNSPPPPPLQSAQRRLGEWRGAGGGRSLQISRLIGVSKRGEGGWVWSLLLGASGLRQPTQSTAQSRHGGGGGGNGRIQEITHSRSAPMAPSSWNPYET